MGMSRINHIVGGGGGFLIYRFKVGTSFLLGLGNPLNCKIIIESRYEIIMGNYPLKIR